MIALQFWPQKLFFHCRRNMASHQILKSPQWAEFSQRFASAGPDWLIETVELSDGAVRGDPSGDNVPTQRLRGQPANSGPTSEVCFLVRSHSFMCATHYQSLCPPLPQTRLSMCMIVCVCVCILPKTSLYLSVTLFCQNWSAYNWESDSGWPELIEARLCFVWHQRGAGGLAKRMSSSVLSGQPLSLAVVLLLLSQAYNNPSAHLFSYFPAVCAPSFYIISVAKGRTSWKMLCRYGIVHAMWQPLGWCQQGRIF